MRWIGVTASAELEYGSARIRVHDRSSKIERDILEATERRLIISSAPELRVAQIIGEADVPRALPSSSRPERVRVASGGAGSLCGIRAEVSQEAVFPQVTAVWPSICKSVGVFLRRFESCTCHCTCH